LLDLAAIPTLHWSHVLLRLGVAAALGGAIGLERELRDREAGLRTHMLVSMGAALFTIVSAYGFHEFLVSGGNLVRTDPTRIAAQIVSGVGFLGAGAIIRQGFSIRGLTTAATLWVVAAIGMAAGAGYYSAATITTVVALVSLGPLRIAAYKIVRLRRGEVGQVLIQLPSGESPAGIVDAVERSGGHIESMEVTQEADRRNVNLLVELRPPRRSPELVAAVADVEGVLEVRWSD
jgi:putative Mg2+ transporter-C (MgtC) family protein